jgi:acyl-CoA thioesterase FadM
MDELASGREVARGKIGVVFIDQATRKPTDVPEAFKAKLQALA